MLNYSIRLQFFFFTFISFLNFPLIHFLLFFSFVTSTNLGRNVNNSLPSRLNWGTSRQHLCNSFQTFLSIAPWLSYLTNFHQCGLSRVVGVYLLMLPLSNDSEHQYAVSYTHLTLPTKRIV